MDDLNLLSKNKSDLQTLLNISEEFFLINNITANPLKTKLISKNSKLNNKTITLFNTPIHPQPPNTPIRILGIWISEKSILSPNRIKIKETTQIISQKLKTKFTTGQIASYIYNKVLLPRIEYLLQVIFLSPNMLLNTQRLIDSTLKHKFNLEYTTPNNWFYSPQIFNIKPISNLQSEVLASNLQYKLSNPTIKPFITLEIKTIQNFHLYPHCIINSPPKHLIENLIIFSASILKQYNISICPPHIITK